MDKYIPYPAEQSRRSGCKVSWRYYDDREVAEKCAEAAKHNANLMYREGYDFGYCSPGTIEWVEAGHEHSGETGRWCVCTA
jgi:hypothetical protein